MAMAKFRLNLTPAGIGSTVEINGVDQADHVRALALRSQHKEITTLTLELIGEAVVEGEGIVEVARQPNDEDLRGYLLEWLSEVDADQITGELADAPMSYGPVEAVLDVLRKRAANG